MSLFAVFFRVNQGTSGCIVDDILLSYMMFRALIQKPPSSIGEVIFYSIENFKLIEERPSLSQSPHFPLQSYFKINMQIFTINYFIEKNDINGVVCYIVSIC